MIDMNRGRGRVWAGLLAIASLLSACTPTTDTGTTQPAGDRPAYTEPGLSVSGTGGPTVGSLPTVTDEDAIVLPLDAYLTSARDRFVGYQATDILVDRCMQRHGFDFRLGIPTAGSQVDHRLFGPVSPELAQKYGYNLPPPAIKDQIAGTEMQQPSEAERVVLLGTTGQVSIDDEPGGCLGQADKLLAQGVPESTISTGVLFGWQNDAASQTMSDSRMIAVTERWSECMARQGYRFHDPVEASKAAFNEAGSATDAEIAQAVADVNCKLQTRYADTGMALMAAYEQRIIEAHGEELAIYLRQQQLQAENAAAVVAGSQGSGLAATG